MKMKLWTKALEQLGYNFMSLGDKYGYIGDISGI